MFLTVVRKNPFGEVEREPIAIDFQGASIEAVLGPRCDDVGLAKINGHFPADWRKFKPGKGDRVELSMNAGGPLIPFIISAVVSLALSFVVKALTPKPKKPSLDSKRAESFGIAGYNNTTGPGTPLFTVYGLDRVHGHVISSGVRLSDDGKSMVGKVMWTFGDTGGDEYEEFSDGLLNDIALDQYPGIVLHTRMGHDEQSVIPGFEDVSNVFTDGRQLVGALGETPVPITVTTRSNTVERTTLFFQFPSGLYRVNKSGNTRNEWVRIRVEQKLNSAPVGSYAEVSGSPFTFDERVQSQIFKSVDVTHGSKGKWDLRITKFDSTPPIGETHVNSTIIFNVQEKEFVTRNYGGDALAALDNIPANMIQSFESLRFSLLTKGKRVKVWTGSADVMLWTRQRCWIVRDMMTHPRVGMGYEIDDDEILKDQWLESQDYYDETVEGHDGDEPRDLCDFVTNESRWDWEWVKTIAGEGRGRIIPSGDKWKYVIDRPGDPGMLYAEGVGGNIIDGSVTLEMAPPDVPYNQIIGEFRNAHNGYHPDISPPITIAGTTIFVQEQRKFISITRESQVDRELMVVLKKNELEKLRWTFDSPVGAIVSEPLDIDYLAERSIANEGAWSGFISSGSTASRLILKEEVTLLSGYVYVVLVQNQRTGELQSREVTNPPGTYIAIDLSSPLPSGAYEENNLYSAGRQDLDHHMTRAIELEMDDEGRVKQMRTEYVPEIYSPDPLPPRQDRRNRQLQFVPPIPLRDATIREEVVANRDGSQRTNIVFDVTPGLPRSSGIVASSSSTTMVLANSEPNRDNYYRGVLMTIVEDTSNPASVGQQRHVTQYGGANRNCIIDSAWSVTPTAGVAIWEARWERFGPLQGFIVEMSDSSPISGFVEVGQPYGTHWEMDGREQGGGLRWFRLTPFSSNVMRNRAALINLELRYLGDQSAPDAPITVLMGSKNKVVVVEVHIRRPTAEDLAGVEIEFYRGGIGGPHIKAVQVAVAKDNELTGTLILRPSVLFEGEDYGTVIICRARCLDTSKNTSAFVSAPSGTILTRAVTDDIDPEAISTISEYAAATATNSEELASLAAPNTGFSNCIWFKCNMSNLELTDAADVRFELRRGSAAGPLIDETSIAVPGQGKSTAVLMGRDLPGAGTHVYKVLKFDSTAATSSFSHRRMLIFEVKR